jgi:hypothetical protein
MNNRLKEFLKPYTKREAGLLYLALAYLLLFEILVQYSLPQFINDRVIFEVGTLLATIEGIFIALSAQIRIKFIRDLVAVGLGVPAIMLTLITVTIASFQSIQLGFLSQDSETLNFRFSVGLFVLLIELYSIGILFSKNKDDQEPSPKGP